MSEVQNECNPCLWTTVRWGTLFICVFDVVYGIVYIVRANRVYQSVETQPQFYINDIKYNDGTKEFWKYGNYLIMILSGAALFLGIKFMPLAWTTYACIIWTFIRVILTITFSILCFSLITSNVVIYRNYGYEVMFNIVLHFYMIYVVYTYGKESREQFKSDTTCKALKIQFSKVHPYKEDVKGLALMSTSIYHIQPHSFQSTASRPADFLADVNLADRDSNDSWDEERYKKYLGAVSAKSIIVHEAFRNADLDDGDIISRIKERISSQDQIDSSKVALIQDNLDNVSLDSVAAYSSLTALSEDSISLNSTVAPSSQEDLSQDRITLGSTVAPSNQAALSQDHRVRCQNRIPLNSTPTPSCIPSVKLQNSTVSTQPPLEDLNLSILGFANSQTSIASVSEQEQWYIRMNNTKTQLNIEGPESSNKKELKK